MLLVACLGGGGLVFVLIGQLGSHGDGTCEAGVGGAGWRVGGGGWEGEQCLSDSR